MYLDVSQLVLNNGASMEFDESVELKDFEFNGLMLHFENAVQFKGTISNVSGTLIMRGRASVDFVTRCSRCLDDVKEHFEFDVDEAFSKLEKGDEDEVIIIDSDRIDMVEVVEKNLCSALPINYLCSEDCKGLCPVCGCNLNKETCDCVDDYIDPRLAALKDFLK